MITDQKPQGESAYADSPLIIPPDNTGIKDLLVKGIYDGDHWCQNICLPGADKTE